MPRTCCLPAVLALLPLLAAEPAKDKPPAAKMKEVAGSAEFLRSVPKHFATLRAVDPARRQVTLLIEGETLPKVWPLAADAEIEVSGWWGRLDQFTVGDRVWVWFQTDRKKQAVAVAMLADELSEQDIHGAGVALVRADATTITVKSAKKPERTLKVKKALTLAKDRPVYVQSGGGEARLVLDPAAFAERRAAQQAALRKRWTEEGLPGSVAFVHRFSGEMDFMLDHEAMRWGRSLKLGDKVTLAAEPPIAAVVKQVRPWRERTEVRLVVHSIDLTELSPGQRLHLKMTPPPSAVDAAALPPDVDRPRSKEERVEWFLASIYCTCQVKGDVCTGHFYTLASCNPNGCAMPHFMRDRIREEIDKGKTDRQIFEELLKEYGPDLTRPHLQP
jgi:hypothetical protein